MSALEEKVERLRQAYLGRLGEHRAALAEADRLRREKPGDTAALDAQREMVHRLAGSSAMYGFADLAAACKALEAALADSCPEADRCFREVVQAIEEVTAPSRG